VILEFEELKEALRRIDDALRAILYALQRQEHRLRRIEDDLAPKALQSSGAIVTSKG
jgi:hypothetical protein